MKKICYFLMLIANPLLISAFPTTTTTPKCVSYQARINDATGMPLANAMIRLKASFIQDTLGATVYIEEHLVQTDGAGMLNVSIGCGKSLLGSFDTLDWGRYEYFLKVEIDAKGGTNYVSLSETKVLTVPMSIWAENARHSNDWISTGGNQLYNEGKKVGIGTNNPNRTLHVKAENAYAILKLERAGTNAGAAYLGGSALGFTVGHYDDPVKETGFNIDFNVTPEGNVGIKTIDPKAALDVNGTTRTKILQITGGDVAEARHPVTNQHLQPGMVVVFDEQGQGKIRTSNQPYDKKVAGVISGAGEKYFAGVCLLQEELAKGALPVAQVGTVEVLCVGPVAVGDLLTTSNVEGYAMAVKKPLRGIGSTIGKATSTLKKEARGLVEMQIEKH